MIYNSSTTTAPVNGNVTFEMITKMVNEKMNKVPSAPAATGSTVNGFITVDDSFNLTKAQVEEIYDNNTISHAAKNLNFKHWYKAGAGWILDADGNRYIDFLSSIGASQLGYNNEFVWSALEKLHKAQTHTINAFSYHRITAAFAHDMAMLSPGGKLTKMHTFGSGSEAGEFAMKTVMLASKDRPERKKFLSCVGAYHGLSNGVIALNGYDHLKQIIQIGFDVDFVPYNDIQAARTALNSGQYMGFFVEPIQGEGGFYAASDEYLREVRDLCTRNKTWLVIDEVQSGTGRTGQMWACEHSGIIPDIMMFAKGVCGSMIPFSGTMMTEEVCRIAYENDETFEYNAGTYQLNEFAAAAGCAVLQYIQENNLLEAAKTKGDYLLKRMNEMKAKYPNIVKRAEGRGLMLGIEMFPVPQKLQGILGDCYGTIVADRCNNDEHLAVLQCTNDLNSIHILPPLTISMDDLEEGCKRLEAAIEFASICTQVTERL